MKACDGCDRQGRCAGRISKRDSAKSMPSCSGCIHVCKSWALYPCSNCRALSANETICNFVLDKAAK